MAGIPEETGKPPAGVVRPPKEISTLIEKTAGFMVRREGDPKALEERMRVTEGKNPKFSFLFPDDLYHAFYEWRMKEIREGRGSDVVAGNGQPASTGAPEKPKGPQEPPEFQFSARMPTISAQDLDILRLTALFVAKNGRSWMTTLSQREAGNFQFDFLRPNHSFYQYFSRLVDQYTDLIQQSSVDSGRRERARIGQLQADAKDRQQLLERAKQRAEYQKWQETQKAKKEEQEKEERDAYAQIDWHDFAIVEEVLFTEADEQNELPPPTSLNDLQSASLEQKAAMSLQPVERRIEETMLSDDMFGQQPQAWGQMPAPPVQPPMPMPMQYPQQNYAPQPSISPAPVPFAPPPPRPVDDEEEQRIRERREAKERTQQAQAAAKGQGAIKIRTDYVPGAQRRENVPKSICPNCKEWIPDSELTEHMRIETLDPAWREQKAKAESRYSTTNLSTADVAGNLKRLASQRSDVFDASGQPISEEEQARRKKAALQYDGTPETRDAMRAQNMNVQDQLANLQSKYRQQG